jgi:hypothetical protein
VGALSYERGTPVLKSYLACFSQCRCGGRSALTRREGLRGGGPRGGDWRGGGAGGHPHPRSLNSSSCRCVPPVCEHAYLHTHTYIYIYIYTYICMYTCICICIYMCHIYIYRTGSKSLRLLPRSLNSSSCRCVPPRVCRVLRCGGP